MNISRVLLLGKNWTGSSISWSGHCVKVGDTAERSSSNRLLLDSRGQYSQENSYIDLVLLHNITTIMHTQKVGWKVFKNCANKNTRGGGGNIMILNSFLAHLILWSEFVRCRFKLFTFSSFSPCRTTGRPIQTKLGTKYPWVKGIQVCSNEGPHPFPREDNHEIAKIHGRIFKNLFLQDQWVNLNQTWHTHTHI